MLEVTPFRKKMLIPVTVIDNLYVCACWTSYFFCFYGCAYVCISTTNILYVKMTLKVGYLNYFVKEQNLNILLLENSPK